MYCAALRRIAAEVSRIQGNAKRFAAQGAEHKAGREKVDATPLDLLTAEAIQQWKLRYIGRHKDAPEKHGHRAPREFLALGAWLESQGVSARKKLHERREERGAVIANSLGIFAASRALRHADIRITSHSVTQIKRYASPPA